MPPFDPSRTEVGTVASAPQARREGPLPCLFSNNSNEEQSVTVLSSYQKKTAFALAFNVSMLARKYGIEHLGFLTLTVAEKHGVSRQEFQRRYNSLNTGFLRKRYAAYIMVPERAPDTGRLHAHLVVVLPFDARTGFNFEEVERKNYRSASEELKEEWAAWREMAPKYKFGRVELMPVKSGTEAIARYVGKYISKQIAGRIREDKGARLVRYSKGANAANCKFAWVTVRSTLWRRKLKAVCDKLGIRDLDDLAEKFGNKWAYHLADAISGLKFDTYRSKEEATADGCDVVDLPDDAIDIRGAARSFIVDRMSAGELETLLRRDRVIVKAVRFLPRLLQESKPLRELKFEAVEINPYQELDLFLRHYDVPSQDDPDWTSGLAPEEADYFPM